MHFSTSFLATITLLSASTLAQRIQFSSCSSCSPPTSPNGAPNCNQAIWQWTGDGDGDCGTRLSAMGSNMCSSTGPINTPDGEGRYEPLGECGDRNNAGDEKGAIVVGDKRYTCRALDGGQFSNHCGITYACGRLMECVA